MEDVTLPRSFEDTTPAEMMKTITRRQSSPSRSPILQDDTNRPTYNAITSTSSRHENHIGNRNEPRTENPEASMQREDEDEEAVETSSEEPAKPWFGRRMWTSFTRWERSHLELVLENKQSVARDHLANERTYLAWLRTSLSFASIGVAITQLFRLSTTIQPGDTPRGFAQLRRLGRPLGATFIGIAVLVLVLGVHRYFTSQYWMTKGKFPASRGAVLLLSLIGAAVTLIAFIIVIIIDPDLGS